MIIFNNIHGRDHRRLYPSSKDESDAIFDISDAQLAKSVNSDWGNITVGDLVCVVQDTYKMSTIYQIDGIESHLVNEGDGSNYTAYVVRGRVLGKFVDNLLYSELLRQFSVNHARLQSYQFCVGFNVADVGEQLDMARIKTREGECTVGELEKRLTEKNSF